MTAKYWSSPVSRCDVCHQALNGVMYDMKTLSGPWGCLCESCALYGLGIGKVGTGYGQKYEKQEDSRWLKTAG